MDQALPVAIKPSSQRTLPRTKMKALPPLVFLLLLLPLASQSPVHSPETLLEILEEDLATLLSDTEGGSPPTLPQESWSRFLRTRQRPLHPAAGPPVPSTDLAWLHFFNDLMTTQKKFRGRTKKMAQQGCFGMKLDRIGTLSGLGC